MSTSERRRQKQRAKKAKKDKIRKAGAVSTATRIARLPPRAAEYAEFPIHECLITASLGKDLGIGSVVVSRKTPGGDLAVGVFLLDIYCLGIKDAWFNVFDPAEYRALVSQLLRADGVAPIEPACARKAVEDGVRYARALGFEPHPDYAAASPLFGDIRAAACEESLTFGYRGKPLYAPGPRESLGDIERIVNTLRANCGEGNFNYILEVLER